MQGGSEEYIRNIINSLPKASEHTFYLFISKDVKGKYLPPNSKNFIEVIVIKNKCNRVRRIFYEQIILPFYLLKYKIDVLVSNYVVPILSPCKTIGIIHDMQYKQMPELFEKTKLFYWNFFIPLTIKKSSLIGTISNFSKDEIINFFPKAKNKIFITSEGVKPSLVKHCKDFNHQIILKENYLLSVATFGKHKNLIILINSMPEVIKAFPEVKLLLIGEARTPDALQSKKNLEKKIENLGLNDKIIFLGFVSDEELANYYHNCRIYIFPSLYEGFGLPLIEAQCCGAPVISSNAGSLPEVGGDSCIYFNPLDKNDLAEKIIQLLKNEGKQKEMIKKGLINSSRFTWEKGAEDLMNAIKEIEEIDS